MPGLAEQIENAALLSRDIRSFPERRMGRVDAHAHERTLTGSLSANVMAPRVKLVYFPTSLGLPSLGNTVCTLSTEVHSMGGTEAKPLGQHLGNVTHQRDYLEFRMRLTGLNERKIPVYTLASSAIARAQQRQEPKKDITKEVFTEAEKRLANHSGLLEQLISIIETEANKLNIPVRKITARPAWSHEYDEETGVVIDIQITGSAVDRFRLWDAISEKIEKHQASFSEKENYFVAKEISFVVNRS